MHAIVAQILLDWCATATGQTRSDVIQQLPLLNAWLASEPGASRRPCRRACSDARLAAIRRLLLDETRSLSDRLAGCLVVLYGQQPSRIATLRTTNICCTDGATQVKPGPSRRSRTVTACWACGR